MRTFIYLLCLLFFAAVQLQAQANTDSIIHLNHLPHEGILLDKGWRYQAGDNPEYAYPDFNDNNWQTVDPTLDVHESLPHLRKGIGWFRLHFLLDSNVLNEQLALIIQQSGASEIYLNGRLLHRFGTLSSDSKKVKAYDPLWKPILFPARGEHQVLAIRYTLQPNVLYTTLYESANPAMVMKVMDLDKAITTYHKQYSLLRTWGSFYAAMFLMFTILHFAFYMFYPAQKANLYFALFTFLYLLLTIVQQGFLFFNNQVAYKYYPANISFALLLVGNLFLLIAIYKLFEQKRDIFFWFLLAFITVSLFLNAFAYDWGWRMGGAVAFMLLQINVARVAYLALKEKKRGAWIIVVGAISYAVFFIAFILQGTFTNYTFLLNVTQLRMLTNAIAVISIPAATSIYLGLDFAIVNKSLIQKLAEIEDLSKKTIQQEQEKQQILATEKERLEQQVKERTTELKQSLDHLKATQAQLIQQEKMASLGELTAGIAHEIQNPLNFVNNFAKTNVELIEEVQAGLQAGNTEEMSSLLNDIKANEQKIHHHGKRADSIVKGMLQHSRVNQGQKEPTDINALIDEYLRLSYQSMRSKDKSFNATIETHFDNSIGKVSIVPQDIGRVLLNLFNNAFYAVQEKKKQSNDTFEPVVSIKTKRSNDYIEVIVKDNGGGIPQKVKDKIFQPFFTTKPTGEGTGLGLSLSYDIITKGHSGELKVRTAEGEGSEFIVQLPL
ncbi:MAG: ATP-binding protein [Bacteroidota bacterium]|nr:ATP-binding protein [Bacteroidota bacterium]